jgi:hypothetical protein
METMYDALLEVRPSYTDNRRCDADGRWDRYRVIDAIKALVWNALSRGLSLCR